MPKVCCVMVTVTYCEKAVALKLEKTELSSAVKVTASRTRRRQPPSDIVKVEHRGRGPQRLCYWKSLMCFLVERLYWHPRGQEGPRQPTPTLLWKRSERNRGTGSTCFGRREQATCCWLRSDRFQRSVEVDWRGSS